VLQQTDAAGVVLCEGLRAADLQKGKMHSVEGKDRQQNYSIYL
jgi:hypothetical protein